MTERWIRTHIRLTLSNKSNVLSLQNTLLSGFVSVVGTGPASQRHGVTSPIPTTVGTGRTNSLNSRRWREAARRVAMHSSFDFGTMREKWSRGMVSRVMVLGVEKVVVYSRTRSRCREN